MDLTARTARAALWVAVGVLVASVHVAAATWALRQDGAALATAPEAIKIDLLPAEPGPVPAAKPQARTKAVASAEPEAEASTEAPAEAPAAPEAEIMAGPEAAAPESAPTADVTPPVSAPPTPANLTYSSAAKPQSEFVPPFIVPSPPDGASLLPAQMSAPPRRPDRIVERAARQQAEPEPKPRRETPRETKKPDPQSRSPRRAEPTGKDTSLSNSDAQQDVKQSAPQQGQQGSRPSTGQMQSWQQTAGARVSAHMARTRATGGRGVVSAVVVVSVQGNGRASGRLTRGTGNSTVDAALARQAARIPRLPPPPDGQTFQFTQPITVQTR